MFNAQTGSQNSEKNLANEILNVNQLSVTIAGVERLKNVSFSLNSGEVLAVIGANGAGKTTLLNAIATDVLPSSGVISFAGRPLHSVQRHDFHRKDIAKYIAVLPQFSLLDFPFTVEEVVMLGRSPHSTGVKIDKDIVQAVAELMDITQFFGRSYTRLSGGEKQRVHLARVMAQIWPYDKPTNKALPHLLLLDEPMSALDLGHQQQVLQALQKFSEQGVGVMMVMHDINLAARYANMLLALGSAKCIAYGKPCDVVQPQIMNKLFNIDTEVIIDEVTGRPLMLIR